MTERAKRVLQMIAAQNGMKVKDAEQEMMTAIRMAMASPDPQIKARWKQIFPDGKEPDLETFLTFMANNINT